MKKGQRGKGAKGQRSGKGRRAEEKELEGFEYHKTEDAELDAELSSIYGGEGGDDLQPDMTRLERDNGSLVRRAAFGLVTFFALLAAVSWVGFFYFSPAEDRFTGESVFALIDGPAVVKSGELVTYRVKYRNGENVPLGTASLDVRLPESFVLHDSEPSTENGTWKIGSLPPKGRGEVAVSGIFLAPLAKEHDIQAILSYRPADFNSEFQGVSTKTVLVEGSVLELEATSPSKALPGDTVDVTFGYRNGSETKFSDLMLSAAWPEGFIPESSEPPATDETLKEWRIEELDAFGSGEIKVTGTFASDAYGDIDFRSELSYLNEDEGAVRQAEAAATTEVMQGELVAALILNGQTDSQPIRFGDMLRFAVSYRNTGSASLGNVELSVHLESDPPGALLLWDDLADETEATRDGDSLTWTSEEIESLERLEPDDEGVVEFELPITAEPPAGVRDNEFELRAWVVTKVESIDGDVVERETKTQPIVAKLLSDTMLTAAARFYNENGIPVGSGNLPPEVGEATTYRMTWTVGNSLHELTDLKLSARLPDNVMWNGRSNVDAGDLRFDAAESKMLWTLNWLPTTVSELEISFDVSITPEDSQRGKVPTLVDATLLEATDKVAGYSLLVTAPPVTTAIEYDEHALGKGRVR
ncbi:hypothetical protein ACFL26_00485 [Patescibacteria group bacterium]